MQTTCRLEVVWEYGEASVFEVRDELAKTREVARNTVRTMMEHLEEKGWLTHRVIGRTHFYSATVPRVTNLRRRIIDFVDQTCGGRPIELMSALIEHRGLTAVEVKRIHKMLADAKKRDEDQK